MSYTGDTVLAAMVIESAFQARSKYSPITSIDTSAAPRNATRLNAIISVLTLRGVIFLLCPDVPQEQDIIVDRSHGFSPQL